MQPDPFEKSSSSGHLPQTKSKQVVGLWGLGGMTTPSYPQKHHTLYPVGAQLSVVIKSMGQKSQPTQGLDTSSITLRPWAKN